MLLKMSRSELTSGSLNPSVGGSMSSWISWFCFLSEEGGLEVSMKGLMEYSLFSKSERESAIFVQLDYKSNQRID